MTRHPGALFGLLIGVASGFAGAFGGFGAFVVVLALGVIGFLVGAVVDGDIDVSAYVGGRRRSDSDR